MTKIAASRLNPIFGKLVTVLLATSLVQVKLNHHMHLETSFAEGGTHGGNVGLKTSQHNDA